MQGASRPVLPFYDTGKLGYGGRFEQAAQRQIHFESIPYSRNQLRSQKRIAAKLEEIAVNPNSIEPQYVGPDLRQQLFSLIAWSGVRSARLQFKRFHSRQRPAIDLSV